DARIEFGFARLVEEAELHAQLQLLRGGNQWIECFDITDHAGGFLEAGVAGGRDLKTGVAGRRNKRRASVNPIGFDAEVFRPDPVNIVADDDAAHAKLFAVESLDL